LPTIVVKVLTGQVNFFEPPFLGSAAADRGGSSQGLVPTHGGDCQLSLQVRWVPTHGGDCQLSLQVSWVPTHGGDCQLSL
jgi:hypothetical protein